MREFEIVREDMRRTNGEIKLPTRATEDSAGYDFYSPIHAVIPPMQSKMIWTDVRAKFNKGEVLLLDVRSSMGKHPVMLSNTIGVIDEGYYGNPENDGNIGIRLFNLGEEYYEINIGDRIAQGILINFLTFDDDNAEKKRTGGFGSTGK